MSVARDVHFIVHTIKNVYGMNPLLVTYNKQYNTDLGISSQICGFGLIATLYADY